ncbi:MAG: PAS domain-containing protein, partial [Deltaproteobacteria bacterium]|nr:PAS domain-containing protein [Deltaproteobacteria bacterium]
MLAGKTEISLVPGKRRIRVLIASGNPERIMLVRESLHAWPEVVVCRVAVSVEDTLANLESHAPHIICWDTGLGSELPAAAREVCVLLLEEDACQLPTEQSSEMALPNGYVTGLQRSINREYELRRALVQLRDAHGSETQGRLLLARATDGIVVVDASRMVVFANPAARGLLGVETAASFGEIFEEQMPEEGKPGVYEVKLANGTTSSVTGTAILSMWDGQEATIIQLQPTLKPSVPPPAGPRVPEDRLRAIGRLAAGLAHEVNNPLTFVLANLESLRESHQIIRRFVRKLRVGLANDGEISLKAFEQLTEGANLQEVIDDAADMLTDCHKGMHR